MVRTIFLLFSLQFLLQGSFASLLPCGGVTLSLTQVGTLPFPMSHTTAIYNLYDSIYLFGGLKNGQIGQGTPMNQIYKYSMSSKAVTQVGTLPTGRYSGVVMKSGITFPKFTYFGVDSDNSSTDPIFLFDSFNNNQLTTIGQIQTVTENLAGVEIGTNGQAYVFGGPWYPWTNVTQLDLTQGTNSIVGDIKLGLSNKGFVTPMPGQVNDYVVLGAGLVNTILDTRLLYFNSSDKSSDILGTLANLPQLDHPSGAYDSDNQYLWIVGGYNGVAGDPLTGIYQIDLNSLAVQWVPVTGFPSGGNMWLSGTSAVYAQGRWKLVLFGGVMRDNTNPNDQGTQVNSIWEIDLTPAYCCGQSNGLFPHPNDCTKFIQCSNQLTALLQCPAPLYYDPILKICNFLNLVTCTLSKLLQF